MKDKDMVSQSLPLGRPSDFFYSPYAFLYRPDQIIGKTALNSFINFGQILSKESSINPVEQHILHSQSTIKKVEEKKNEALKKLYKIVSRSNEVLATATAVFPFDLFPDSVTLDRTKVTITKRSFFWSAEVISIRIEDILNISSGVGPFFGSITIASRVMSSEDHFTIDYFWRKDAIRLKHIIQGYVIAHHNDIKVSHLSKKEMIATLSELGHDNNG
ncbi:MAG: hypothetical protein WAP35_10850 [Solirubrobacterales bacterium]